MYILYILFYNINIYIYIYGYPSEIGDRFVRDFEHGAPKDYYRFTAPIDCISMSGAQLTSPTGFLNVWHGMAQQWGTNGAPKMGHVGHVMLLYNSSSLQKESCGPSSVEAHGYFFSFGSEPGPCHTMFFNTGWRNAGEAGVRLQCRAEELDLWMVWGKETCWEKWEINWSIGHWLGGKLWKL